MTYIFNLMN